MSKLLPTITAFLLFNVVTFSNANTTVFTNVNVVPMTTDTVLKNQTVIVEGDRISAIYPTDKIEVPAGAEVIDGKGNYLMPGLADMHIHLFGWDPDPRHLNLYLAQGTTTIRSVGEANHMLSWREQVRNGELEGPTIYSSGRVIVGNDDNFLGFDMHILIFRMLIFMTPFLLGLVVYWVCRPLRSRRNILIATPMLLIVSLALTLTKTPNFAGLVPLLDPELAHGYLAETPARAVDEVRNQHKLKVDGVKLYDGLTEEMFMGALAEAKKLGLYAHTHLPDQMELQSILDAGVNEVLHLDEFNSFHWSKPNDQVMADFMAGIEPKLDVSRISHSVELMVRNKVALVSNLSADEVAYQMILNTPKVLARPKYRVVRPKVIEMWKTQGRPITKWKQQGHYRGKELSFFKTLLKSMQDAGVVITLGTDSARLMEGSLPGNIHRELELLVESGFSHYEALIAGTKNAGIVVKRMGRDGNFGTVKAGQRADLLLLEGNPLEDVSQTRNRIGVMARGKWYTQEQLNQKVDSYVSDF